MATQTIPQLSAEVREKLGTRYTRRLRDQGQLPAVVYGHGEKPLHVSVSGKELVDLLHHNAHLVELSVGSETVPCLVKEVQWDHLSAHIIHADLTRVDLNERVTVDVEIELFGDAEAPGLKEDGAILEQPLANLQIECLATDIPEKIRVDVSGMNAGDSITVADVSLPDKITASSDPETTVAHIAIVQEVSEEEIAGEAGEAEPEVIGRPAEGEEDGGGDGDKE